MSLSSVRGGFPHVFSAQTIGTGGVRHGFPFTSNHLKVRVTTNPCLMYFTEADFTAGTNPITIPVAAAATPYGEWEGPVEAKEVWLKGSGGNTVVELVAFQRRG
jgi:hypothetical protein